MDTTHDVLILELEHDAQSALDALSVRISDRCTACGNCLVTCPTAALQRAPSKPDVLDSECIGCGECIEVCPVGAITDFAVPQSTESRKSRGQNVPS